MTFKQAMAKLKSLGNAQTRKVYRNHGVTGEMFGKGDIPVFLLGAAVDRRRSAGKPECHLFYSAAMQ